jgi:glutaredoxin
VTTSPTIVTLYTKPGCHLCDVARSVLEEIAAEPDQFRSFQFDEVDIRHDANMFERYRYRIPVITIDGEIIAEGNIDDLSAAVLQRALAK